MRNKQQLNDDFDKVATPLIKDEVDIVQMAAHDMRHTGILEVSLQPEHTVTGKETTFRFKPIVRAGTADEVEGLRGSQTVEDFEYLGMEEV